MRLVELKVKIKSLAAESRIIAREQRRLLARIKRANAAADTERKAQHWGSYHSLHSHRRTVVGETAREALLAYGFLRGRPYERLEPATSRQPDWDSVWKVAARFAPSSGGSLRAAEHEELTERWDSWKGAAERYFSAT